MPTDLPDPPKASPEDAPLWTGTVATRSDAPPFTEAMFNAVIADMKKIPKPEADTFKMSHETWTWLRAHMPASAQRAVGVWGGFGMRVDEKPALAFGMVELWSDGNYVRTVTIAEAR